MGKLVRMKRRDILKTGLLTSASLFVGGAFPVHAQGATRKINIVNTSGGTNLVLAAMMKQQSIFEQFGLEATITNVADGAKLMGGILTGEMDICPLSGFGQVFPAIEKSLEYNFDPVPLFTTFCITAFNFLIVSSEQILGLMTCLSYFFIVLFHSFISETN